MILIFSYIFLYFSQLVFNTVLIYHIYTISTNTKKNQHNNNCLFLISFFEVSIPFKQEDL